MYGGQGLSLQRRHRTGRLRREFYAYVVLVVLETSSYNKEVVVLS